MRISHDLRDGALDGMARMSQQFVQAGGELYPRRR